MTQVALFGLKAAVSSAVSGAILAGAAWGTRYVSQIPTQDAISAGIVSATMTNVSTILNKLFLLKDWPMDIYLQILRIPTVEKPQTQEERDLTKKKATLYVSMMAMGFGFFVSTAAAPTIASLVGRNLSYQTAAMFSFINIIPTLIANNFSARK